MMFLAVRHLTSRKRQTTLTVLGITLGTAAFVAISGMMTGFQTFIIDQLINNDSHIRISSREEPITKAEIEEKMFPGETHVFWLTPPSGRRDSARIENPGGWIERLGRDPNVQAFSPQLQTQVLARRGNLTVSARLIGSDPARQIQVTNIEKYMIAGHFRDIGASGNRILIGEGLGNRLGAQVGDRVLISVGTGAPVPFKVVGLFRLGIRSLDDSTIFGALSDVQAVNQTPSQISDIAIRLVDVSFAREIATSWAPLSSDKVQSWDQANEGIMSVFKTQDITRHSMTVSILVVAGFGIYNILSMAVNQRKREIAILRSMGYEAGDILGIFLKQGILLGAIGSFIGLVIGYFLCRYMETIEISPQRGMGGSRMMVSFAPKIYIQGFLLGFGSATLASLLPARAAGRMEPIEIIRSEGT